MTFNERLKGVGIALIIAVTGIPVAVAVTIITSPFWSWLENTFVIESFGHSGPAEWCYLISYVFVLAICTLVWSLAKRRTSKKKLMHDYNEKCS